ncbi:MAG: (p)ppGpp synthetase [Cyanobacteria bacterium J06634_6]
MKTEQNDSYDDLMGRLEIEYNSGYERFQGFSEAVERELSEILRKSSIELAFPIQRRVKSWKSIKEKCERNSNLPNEIKRITDLRDLIGIRLVLTFERNIEEVHKALSSFIVTRDIDKADDFMAEQFGYRSRHFQVKPPLDWFNVPSFAGFSELQYELQVRTMAQHTWANASRILQYKSEESVPYESRRAIHRLAALLELIDLEFERVLKNKDKYENDPISNLSIGRKNLNVDLLKRFLSDYLPNNPEDQSTRGYDYLRQQLTDCKITNISELRKLLDKTCHINREEELRQKRALELNEEDISDLCELTMFSRVEWVLYSLKMDGLKPDLFV